MNSRYRMIDDMLEQWVDAIEDEELLAKWKARIEQRITALESARTFTDKELADGLRRCNRGETIYFGKRFRGKDGKLNPTARFLYYQPRANRLWFALGNDPLPTGTLNAKNAYYMSGSDITFYQPARVDLATRRRAAIIKERKHLK